MTISYSLQNQPTSVTDTNLDMWLLNQTLFKKIGETTTPNLVQVDYVYASASPEFRVTLRVTTQLDKVINPNNLLLMRRTTMKLAVPIIREDDTGDAPDSLRGYCEFWQGFAVPADESIGVDVVAKWLTTNTGLFFPSYTAGVPATTTLTTLAYRHTEVY